MAIRIDQASHQSTYLFSPAGYGKLLVVPSAQRRYKWERKQVDELWNDIYRAYQEGRSAYFLGTLLLIPHESNESTAFSSIIDGQQRIATLSLLLAVLRDYCSHYKGLEGRARGLQELVTRLDNNKNFKGFVVTLQESDSGVYQQLVKETGSTEKLQAIQPASHKLVKAVQALRKQVDSAKLDEFSLEGLCEFIQENVNLLPIEVSSEPEAHLLFDTTNTRGLKLSPGEALKAHVAATTRENQALSAQYIKKWRRCR